MNIISTVYQEALFEPLFNLLVGITNILPNHNVGIAIIVVTLVVRLILLPSSLHQARQLQLNQTKLAALRADLKKIQEQHKNDQTKKAQATMELYRKAGINPLSGCLPLVIQLPILIALYRVFLVGLGPDTWHHLYSFVSQPESLQLMFLTIDLAQPSVLLGVITGIAQFFQMRFATPKPFTPSDSDDNAQMMASMQRNMAFIFPVMTVFIALRLPAALALYWVASTVFGLAQHYLIKRTMHVSVDMPVT
jgi:YidC/Oxa1 family membrane protein insertase